MSLSFKKTCNVAIASAAVGLAQHFAGKELHQGPYLVKQVGALNMKLQMQLASKGSAVAKGSYPNVKGAEAQNKVAKSHVPMPQSPPPRRPDEVDVISHSKLQMTCRNSETGEHPSDDLADIDWGDDTAILKLLPDSNESTTGSSGKSAPVPKSPPKKVRFLLPESASEDTAARMRPIPPRGPQMAVEIAANNISETDASGQIHAAAPEDYPAEQHRLTPVAPRRPRMVKQVGALNMKLQMQRKEVEANAHPAVATVTVMPHSYEGKQLIDRQKTDVDPSAENVVVLDPAGEFYMQTDIKGYGAGAASGAIYKFLNSDGKGPESRNYESQFPLPSDASENLKEAGKAHYVDYRVKNNFADLTNELSIVHAIGPNGGPWKLDDLGNSVRGDYTYSKADEKRFVQDLLQTYKNAFHEFAKQQTFGKTEFWVVPVSSGVFCPGWLKGSVEQKQNFASMTAVLIRQAMKHANIENAAVKMHLFDQSEVQDYEDAFNSRNLTFTVDGTAYNLDNLESLVLEPESGVKPLGDSGSQIDCPGDKFVASKKPLNEEVFKDCPENRMGVADNDNQENLGGAVAPVGSTCFCQPDSSDVDSDETLAILKARDTAAVRKAIQLAGQSTTDNKKLTILLALAKAFSLSEQVGTVEHMNTVKEEHDKLTTLLAKKSEKSKQRGKYQSFENLQEEIMQRFLDANELTTTTEKSECRPKFCCFGRPVRANHA